MRIIPSATLLVALVPLVSGCGLVDQRTVARWFGGQAVAPSKADLAAAELPPLPLVTVRFEEPEAEYHRCWPRRRRRRCSANPTRCSTW